MVCLAPNHLQYPLNTSELYLLRYQRDLFSTANFFFATSNGAGLVPATNDMTRFIGALTATIADFPKANFVHGLQALLDALTAEEEAESQPPAPPRYPQAGDTNVLGVVLRVGKFGEPSIYAGLVKVAISANGYSTPPAYSPEVQFRFCFSTTTPVVEGQTVRFDLVEGKFVPKATNIVV